MISHLASCGSYQQQAALSHSPSPAPQIVIQRRLTDQGISRLPRDRVNKLHYLFTTALLTAGRPFSLFESTEWDTAFFEAVPGYKPPERQAVKQLLPTIYTSYHDLVLSKLRGARALNLIFDASDTIASHRIINIAVHIPGGEAYYWRTFDTGAAQHTAEGYIKLIWPEIERVCEGDWSRINSICTDTDGTMRACHTALAKTHELKHCFFSLCDSHGLQLLVKDVLSLEFFTQTFSQATDIITFFSKSKLQLSRLRLSQVDLYSRTKGFIKR